MTQEEKDLLLKDLCARLPYGVKILYDIDKKFKDGLICQPSGLIKFNNRTCLSAFGVVDPIELDEYKPYLCSLDNITDEEFNEFEHLRFQHDDENWLEFVFSRHLDWRGFIPKNLALEALEGMYKTK